MKIKMRTMAIIVFVIIFGGIAATIAADLWSTESNKIPVKYKEGEFEGQYNPQDIRGSYSFQEISELFEIDLDVLYKAFGIDEKTETQFKSKDLETLYGDTVEIGNESMQIFVALYKNLPITLDEAYLPKQAVDIILKTNNNLTDEQLAYLSEHQVELPTALPTITEVVSVDEEKSEEPLINGSTTFKQALEAGISKEQIEEIIGKELPPTNTIIKDFCINEGLTFSVIKNKLNELVEN